MLGEAGGTVKGKEFDSKRFFNFRFLSECDDYMRKLLKEFGTMANYYVPSRKRTFTISLNDGKVYVNPKYLITMSEKFRDQFDKINDVNGEIHYDDIPVAAMRLVLESICPTLHLLYPIPIQLGSLATIIPVASQLQMPGLLDMCARVLDDEVPKRIVTSYGYLKYFDLAYRHRLRAEIQAKLLYYLLGFNFVRNAVYMDETILSSATGTVYFMALSMKRERFPHNVYECLLMPSAMQNVRCARCVERRRLRRRRRRSRCWRPRRIIPPILLTQCVACSKLLCDRCVLSPCISELKKFLINNPPSRFPNLSQQ